MGHGSSNVYAESSTPVLPVTERDHQVLLYSVWPIEARTPTTPKNCDRQHHSTACASGVATVPALESDEAKQGMVCPSEEEAVTLLAVAQLKPPPVTPGGSTCSFVLQNGHIILTVPFSLFTCTKRSTSASG